MSSNDRINWDLFKIEFRKKYEFVQLNKYAHNIVSNKEEMCIRFEDGLNDDIRMSMAALKFWEFVELSKRA
ncbi:Retrotransposon gag domain-containing 1 [Gossypium australe]|uniref:Retrotransposon gag domain-containing 1 n=1 Tax=Gossypium australe TaxID=47621 RepID=A0A5B6VY74_9ROSI|nr:Retrotransposon gag domain-containing 1 [Gossypium australe]